ncbi:MAG: host attachment protein [Nitrospirae bacterium]|nr:host attachment protein [Nitrospirota bacterium]
MDKTIIVVADLGHFKAYRITEEPLESPRVLLIESYDSLEGHGKLVDKLSDMAGRFGRGGGKDESAMGSGERHTIGLETEKRLIKLIAKNIDTLISNEKCETWCLAASKKINRPVVESLKPGVKAKLDKNITADLTKIDKSEILNYFFAKERG